MECEESPAESQRMPNLQKPDLTSPGGENPAVRSFTVMAAVRCASTAAAHKRIGSRS